MPSRSHRRRRVARSLRPLGRRGFLSRLSRLSRLLGRRRRVGVGPGRPDDPPWFGPGDAGVREPRRPKPGPSAAAAAAEPPRDQHLDVTSEPH